VLAPVALATMSCPSQAFQLSIAPVPQVTQVSLFVCVCECVMFYIGMMECKEDISRHLNLSGFFCKIVQLI